MTKIVKFDSAAGPVLVEIEGAAQKPGPRSVSRGGAVIEEAGDRFEAAVASIRPVAEAILGQLTNLPRAPETVEVRFGMKLSGELGFVLASSTATAHCEIKLGWSRPDAD